MRSSNILVKLFIKFIFRFDLATSLFRSFELFVIEGTLQNLKPRGPILDIGCAEGNIAKEVFKNNRVLGLDNEVKYLHLAKKLNVYKSLLAADAKHIPYKDNTFNFLFSNSVLEHIDKIDVVLDEAKRILKPEGLFLFTVPNNNFSNQLFFCKLFRTFGLKKLAINYSKERNRRLNHFHLFSHETWIEKINKSGFRLKLMRDYAAGEMLMLWDLIAATQFFLRKATEIFFKIPIIKEVLLAIGFSIKMVFAIVLVPLILCVKNKQNNNCATLIIVSKE